MEKFFGLVEIRTTGAKLYPGNSEKSLPLWIYRQTGLIPVVSGEANLPDRELILRKIGINLAADRIDGHKVEIPNYRLLIIILGRAQTYLLEGSPEAAVDELMELAPGPKVVPLVEAAGSETAGSCLGLVWRRTREPVTISLPTIPRTGLNEINRRRMK